MLRFCAIKSYQKIRFWKRINHLAIFFFNCRRPVFGRRGSSVNQFVLAMIMKLQTIKSEGLAHNSYFLADQGEAVVVDPRRDCEIYSQLAKEECVQIKFILETHRNEDYVTGSMELQNTTEAEIAHSNALSFKYGEHNLTDRETLNFGDTEIKVVYTPGHTDESLCYVVYPTQSTEASLVFTGDTLFAGSVGRTDLYGKPAQRTQAEKLYSILHEKLLPLGDHVLVYPAHGAGSVCGHGISGMVPTTLGYEKKTNPYLQLTKEELIGRVFNEELVVPRYFRKMEELNLKGPPLLSELSYPKPLSLSEFEEEMQQQNMIVMDTRMPYAYAGSHIPNSLNLWLGGTSVYPGWLLETSQYIVFVHERPSDIDIVAPMLRRLGFDNMCGYLCGGMEQWQEAGKPISSFGTISAIELKDKLEKQETLLLDVREPSEWKIDGYVEGAKLIFFADLLSKAGSLPKDKPIAVTCSVGKHSSVGASILEREGFKNVSNVLGGMTAWYNLGYPTKKDV
jgi:hydroxyacylglutathione hydrolase